MLEQFALVNLSVYKDSVVTACERLHSLVLQNAPPTGALTDPDDVNFIAKAVNNYMMYAASESDLGMEIYMIQKDGWKYLVCKKLYSGKYLPLF